MDEIFKKRGSILVKNVIINKKRSNVFIGENGKIEELGEDVGTKFQNKAEFVIEGKSAYALPGFVNTHTHAAMTLLRGYADDMQLQPWLSDKIWPLEAHLTAEDVYSGTRLACIEMIASGTTTFNDMYFFMDAAARAVDETGIRATLAHGFIDLSIKEKLESEIVATENFVRSIKSRNNPRIKAAVGPHAIYTVSEVGLRWCSEFAKNEEICIHIHLSETEGEVNDSVKAKGKRPPEVLNDCGILTDKTIAAHCCWLNIEECSLLAKKGTHVAHNPVSNMKLAVNKAMPYQWLKNAKTNVTLGTDGCASNNNLDMIEEMKFAALLQKFASNDPTILPADEVLKMGSAAGASALGMGATSIAVGQPADIILIDPEVPMNTPIHNPVSNLVYSCNGSVVRTTICDGRVLMLDRIIPNEQEIRDEAKISAKSLVERTLI